MNQAHPLARFGNQYMHSTNSFVDDNEQKERIFEFSWMMIFNIIRERLIFHSSAYPCKSHSQNAFHRCGTMYDFAKFAY